MSINDALPPEGLTAVYRAYNDSGELLYVGISQRMRLAERMRHHAARTPWWPEVVAMGAVWYRSRHEALSAEALAIADEGPLHNVRRAKRPIVAPEPLPFRPLHDWERVVRLRDEPLTHFFHCWRFPEHHACAVALIERQAREYDELLVRAARAERAA